MTLTKLIRFLLNTFLVFSLSGCGFHFREQPHELSHITIVSNQPYSHFIKYLAHSFKPSTDPNAVTLLISSVKEEQVLTAIGGTTQPTRQYRLHVIIEYQLIDHCKRVLLEANSIDGERNQTIQANQVMSTSNETNLLFRQIEAEIANTLYYRLNSKQVKRLLNENWNKPC